MGEMRCPCCGHERECNVEKGASCGRCGARQVGMPLTPPDRLLPKVGPALIAGGVTISVMAIFLTAWVLSNDARVFRVAVISLLGEEWKITRSLLAADPSLPYYRIFRYDAVRLAFWLSSILIPLSLLGVWLSRRAKRLVQSSPNLFTGRRLAQGSLVLSTATLVGLCGITVSLIPEQLERFRERRRAQTRAVMYQLHQQALQKYYVEYGSYPQELIDLSRVNVDLPSQLDPWEQPFTYQPVGVIASKGASIIFSNYRLVSAGADGRFATADDLVMIDGIIVEGDSAKTENGLSIEDLFPSKY
jgi:hypothetical protein